MSLNLFQHIFGLDRDLWGEHQHFYPPSDFESSDDEMERLALQDQINRHAEQNARELVAEEEKEKRKQAKKRARKKKRKEKKKMVRDNLENGHSDNAESTQDDEENTRSQLTSDDSAEEGIDPASAFASKAVGKKQSPVASSKPIALETHTKKKKKKKKKMDEQETEALPVDPVILRSRKLAIGGNEMANMGHFQAAVELFSEAIKLEPKDHRYLGNRSYCYDRLEQFDKALKDAEKAINLAPDWAKGYFRKGRALRGLEQYAEAEAAFSKVIKLDKSCEEAVEELAQVQMYQIMEMGFSESQARAAIKHFPSVQAALDSLLSGLVGDTSIGEEIFVSDDEDFGGNIIPRLQKPDSKMDPKNPEGLSSLWVGNVMQTIQEKDLVKLFSKFGTVTSVRLLPDKFCAFINYSDKRFASAAMQKLQNFEIGGNKLLIKFPDNPVTNNSQQNLVLRKSKVTQSASTPTATTATKTVAPKTKGPVNGDECYFWRTTGCVYGNNCKFKHVKENRGVDKRPWHNK